MSTLPAVQALTLRDGYAARRLIRECFPTVDENGLRRALCRDRRYGGVIMIEGALVGVINLRLPDASTAGWLDSRTLWVQSVAVAPRYRGEGLGSALMEWAQGFAWQHDFGAVALSVSRTNHSAVRLYEKLGYVPVPEGETQRMTLVLQDAAPQPLIEPAVHGLARFIPERVRLLPLHLAYGAMAEFQDHIAPWFNLGPLVSTIDRR